MTRPFALGPRGLAGIAAGVLTALIVGALLTPADEPPGEPEPVARKRGRSKAARPLDPHKLPKSTFEVRRDVTGRVAPPPGAPNVVVVMGCTLRRDTVTPYGGPAEATPWLDRLARDGVVFEDAIASSSWTKESATALFTGQQALTVGMVDPGPHHSVRVLSPSVETLAERLAGRGWYTLGVTANPHLNTDFGMAQGFDHYRDTASAGFARRNKIDGADVVASVLEMLDDRGDAADRPFYARLVLIDPHIPLTVDPDEVARFAGDGVSARLATYLAGVRRTDDALRQLDEGLAARGYGPDDTLFVFVTDHGEGLNLPPHHRDQHGRVLYPSVTRVPWMLRGPGVAAGHRIGGLASHLDVLPTVLGLLGMPEPDLPGLDLSAATKGASDRTRRSHAYTDTWYFGANRAAVFTDTRACQKDFGSVGIRDDSFVEGCFDRVADPDFYRAFADDALLADLVTWRAARQAEYDAWPDVRDVGDEGADLSEQLEALGYVE